LNVEIAEETVREKKLHGLCIGFPNNGDEEKTKEALALIAPHTEWIRVYGFEEYKYAAHARSLGMKFGAGAWLGRDTQENDGYMAKVIEAAQSGAVDLAIIGNETLLRNDLTPAQLHGYIEQFKNSVPDFPVCFAEVARFIYENPEIIEPCDFVGMHHYPYWEGVHTDKAIEDFDAAYRKVRSVAHGKEIRVLETGWPSAGRKSANFLPASGKDDAVASPANARKYFKEFSAWAKKNDVKFYWFEAFDEAWKVESEGPPGAHWGMWPAVGKRRKYR
jgi:GPH family glycoside/pentoside/hexuronide:cation symporter